MTENKGTQRRLSFKAAVPFFPTATSPTAADDHRTSSDGARATNPLLSASNSRLLKSRSISHGGESSSSLLDNHSARSSGSAARAPDSPTPRPVMHALGGAASASASLMRRREAAADAAVAATSHLRSFGALTMPVPPPPTAALSPTAVASPRVNAFKATALSMISKAAGAQVSSGVFGSGSSALASAARAVLDKSATERVATPNSPLPGKEGVGVNRALERLAGLKTLTTPPGPNSQRSSAASSPRSPADRSEGAISPPYREGGGVLRSTSGRYSLNNSQGGAGGGGSGDSSPAGRHMRRSSTMVAPATAVSNLSTLMAAEGAGGTLDYIPLEDRALHPHFLQELMARGFDSGRCTWLQKDMKNFTIGDVVSYIVKPTTARLSLDYVQSTAQGDIQLDWCKNGVMQTPAALGKPFYGPTTYFVSHAWSYKFSDLVTRVFEHYRHLPGTEDGEVFLPIYYWLDIFAVTQHFVGQFTDSSDSDFPRVIRACKQMLCVAIPRLPKPTIFSRVWCLYEILNAVNYDVDVELLMEPMTTVADTAAFDILDRAVAQIDVLDAQATVQVDYRYIMEQIKEQPGIDEFNRILQNRIKHSMLSAQLKMAVERGNHETALHLIHKRGATYDFPNEDFHFERVIPAMNKDAGRVSDAGKRLSEAGMRMSESGGGAVSRAAAAAVTWATRTARELPFLSPPAGDLAAQVLAEMLRKNKTITSVVLRGVSDSGLVALGKSLSVADSKLKNVALVCLNLSNNHLGSAGAAALGLVLQYVTSLRKLDLSDAQGLGGLFQGGRSSNGGNSNSLFTPPLARRGVDAAMGSSGGIPGMSGGMRGFSEGLARAKSLQVLLLPRTNIDAEGATVLADALATGPPLTTLIIDGNPIADAGTVALARAISRNRSITEMSLNACGVGQAGACALGQAMSASPGFAVLRLTDNAAIGDSGVAALATALRSSPGRMRILHLNNVGLGVVGAVALADALQTPGGSGIKDLDVADNFDLGRPARIVFKKLARNKDLVIVWDDYTTTF